MKYFIITDAHGFADQLQLALDKAGYDINNPEHFFVSLGDLLDRGRQPRQILKFVLSIPRDRRILIKGNHEYLIKELINKGFYESHDLHNGTVQTIIDLEPSVDNFYSAVIKVSRNKLLNDYLASTVNYAEVGNNIFVHGWIPSKCHRELDSSLERYNESYEKISNWRKGDWQRACWLNGMHLWQAGVRIKGKTIYCGHYHTSWGHCNIEKSSPEFGKDADFSPFINKGICALDSCCAYSGFINCVTIDISEDNNETK